MDHTLSIENRRDLNLAVWRVTGDAPIQVMIDCTHAYVRERAFRPCMNLLCASVIDEKLQPDTERPDSGQIWYEA